MRIVKSILLHIAMIPPAALFVGLLCWKLFPDGGAQ
jgi:hypothetical protein